MPTKRLQRPRGSAQGGFTLTEVMVVVAIVGITASLALAYLDSGKKGRAVEGYTERLADQFSLARQRAVASQKRQRITILDDGFSHWESIQTGLAEVADPSDPNNWTKVFEKTAPRGVTIAATDNVVHVDQGVNVPDVGDGVPFEIDILPDGRARSALSGSFFESGWTVFIEDEDGKQMRAALFGVTGTASVYDGW